MLLEIQPFKYHHINRAYRDDRGIGHATGDVKSGL